MIARYPHEYLFMDSIPPEILFKIFDSLPTTTLAAIASVNRLWRAISAKILYTNIEHHAWKPKRVSICLQALSSNYDGTLATIVRHLDLRLWSTDPEFSHLLIDALMQTDHVTKLKLTMSETFSYHFETHLLERGIIAADSVSEGEPQLWSKQFLPLLEELELSHGHRPFQLAAGRPVRCISSPTHMDYHALQRLLPFLQRSSGPVQAVHFNLTGRDTGVASKALSLTATGLPYLSHVFFNFFVSRRSHPAKFTPDLLEDLSSLAFLHSVELLLSRHARSPDPYLYSHFAAVHTLKATACSLTHVIIDTIRWEYRSPRKDNEAAVHGWSPLPSDFRTHSWWLGQYGDAYAAHAAMLALWENSECSIPLQHEIGRTMTPMHDHRDDQMSIEQIS